VADNRLVYSNTTLDLSAYTLSTAEKSISLTSKEFELLRYLFEYPNFVATKDDLILKAWGLDSDFESNNLEVYISFIRKKLGHVGADFSIEAVRGVGYRLTKK
jgi:DNA-binding response OmpR family regulator